MFARVIGPFLAAIAIVAAVRAPDMATLLAQFTAGAVWPWVTGAFILLGGISIVAFHQYWRGPAEVIISALGWLLVVRGVVLLAFPSAFAAMANRMIGWSATLMTMYVVLALIGLYLTFVGWLPAKSEKIGRAAQASTDLPRAA
jgi:hypothetical protein